LRAAIATSTADGLELHTSARYKRNVEPTARNDPHIAQAHAHSAYQQPEAIGGYPWSGQILRLRRKIETNPSQPEYIKTERGAGYIFDTPVEVLH
jgi:hypothetical protein